jgi:hypothetical protein
LTYPRLTAFPLRFTLRPFCRPSPFNPQKPLAANIHFSASTPGDPANPLLSRNCPGSCLPALPSAVPFETLLTLFAKIPYFSCQKTLSSKSFLTSPRPLRPLIPHDLYFPQDDFLVFKFRSPFFEFPLANSPLKFRPRSTASFAPADADVSTVVPPYYRLPASPV